MHARRVYKRDKKRGRSRVCRGVAKSPSVQHYATSEFVKVRHPISVLVGLSVGRVTGSRSGTFPHGINPIYTFAIVTPASANERMNERIPLSAIELVNLVLSITDYLPQYIIQNDRPARCKKAFLAVLVCDRLERVSLER